MAKTKSCILSLKTSDLSSVSIVISELIISNFFSFNFKLNAEACSLFLRNWRFKLIETTMLASKEPINKVLVISS